MKTILVINALNGSLPLVLREKYPSAKITCAEVFPFFRAHLSRMGFEVIDWEAVGDMKFDLVIGNPPYQEISDTGGNLWLKFLSKGVELLNDTGKIAFVTPPTFIGRLGGSNPSKGKSKYNAFDSIALEKLVMLEDNASQQFFPGVGSKICWYIGSKDGKKTETEVVGYKSAESQFKIKADLYDQLPLPSKINELTMAIHCKLKAAQGIKFSQQRELHYFTLKKKNQVVDIADTTHQYKSYFSHNIIRYTSVKCSHYTAIKVMIPQTSTVDKAFVDQNCNVSEDLFFKECNNQEEAIQLLKHLNSPLVKYIGVMYRAGRNLGQLLGCGLIPNTSNTLELSTEEQKYIHMIAKVPSDFSCNMSQTDI